MPHPIMFRDDDPGLSELRETALGFPDTFEKVSHGRPVFCVPKIFAQYGGSAKGERGGEHIRYPHSVLIKVDDSERAALQADTRFFFPAYVGPYGWLGLDLSAARVDWAEVTELIDASYRLVAPKKSLRRLDER